MPPLLVLVGPPGSGKTTVGRLVAESLAAPFLDTDHLIENQAGKAVADIFIEDGEERFRELEQAAVTEALSEHAGVLALGGGAVLNPSTREALQSAPVLALAVGLTDAVARVGLARDRPLLLDSPRARIAAMLRDRAPLYNEVARRTVDTSGRTPDDIAAEVVRWLQQERAGA
ncbi:MAG TPA: shikimate kinase [Frankiaceae bacterium]|nr:shikimate kinase [Frankiaceae bacterium]